MHRRRRHPAETVGNPPHVGPMLVRLTHLAERIGMSPITTERWLTDRYSIEILNVGPSRTRYVRGADAARVVDDLMPAST